MIYLSTYLRNLMLHTSCLRDVFNTGCSKVNVYSGTVPASADAAATGTLLCTLTNGGSAVKAAQSIRFTPTVGTANGGVWGITLNGVSATYTDDGSPTAAEICTGLYNAWRVASGLIAATTPACTINNPKVYGKFVLTDNTGTLDITASVSGIGFDYATTITGAGAGTGSWATSIQTADSYGVKFEDVLDITSGVIEKLASMTIQGTNVGTGTPTYYRLVLDGDTGALSTTAARVQGSVATANSDMNFPSTQWTTDDIQFLKTYSLTFPASRS
jgi:hypothetical protein